VEQGGRAPLRPAEIEGVRVTVRQSSGTIGARDGAIGEAVTNGVGAAGLTFTAPVEWRMVPPTSENLPRQHRPWVVLTLEKAGYQTLELPLQPEDFVETRELRLLTRGVILRRAS
jgi:hypothetical protein